MKTQSTFKLVMALALMTIMSVLPSTYAQARDGGAGTGGGDLSGVCDSPDLIPISQDTEDFQLEMLFNGDVRNQALRYLDLLQDTSVDYSPEHTLLRSLYSKMRPDIAAMVLDPKDECKVDGRVTSMSTLKGVPGAKVCVNVKKIRQQLSYQCPGLGNSLASLMIHESARHFGLEDTTSDFKHPLSMFVGLNVAELSHYRYIMKNSEKLTEGLLNIKRGFNWAYNSFIFAENSVQNVDIKFKAKKSCFPINVEIFENPKNNNIVRKETLRSSGDILNIKMSDTYILSLHSFYKQSGIQVRWTAQKSCNTELEFRADSGSFATRRNYPYGKPSSGSIRLDRIPLKTLP